MLICALTVRISLRVFPTGYCHFFSPLVFPRNTLVLPGTAGQMVSWSHRRARPILDNARCRLDGTTHREAVRRFRGAPGQYRHEDYVSAEHLANSSLGWTVRRQVPLRCPRLFQKAQQFNFAPNFSTWPTMQT